MARSVGARSVSQQPLSSSTDRKLGCSALLARARSHAGSHSSTGFLYLSQRRSLGEGACSARVPQATECGGFASRRSPCAEDCLSPEQAPSPKRSLRRSPVELGRAQILQQTRDPGIAIVTLICRPISLGSGIGQCIHLRTVCEFLETRLKLFHQPGQPGMP